MDPEAYHFSLLLVGDLDPVEELVDIAFLCLQYIVAVEVVMVEVDLPFLDEHS